MNAPFTAPDHLPDSFAERQLDAVIGFLFDVKSYERIIVAWRSGRISDSQATLLITECGLGGLDELANSH